MTYQYEMIQKKNLWINDTASTSSVINALDGMTELVKINESIKVVAGHKVKVDYKGKFNGHMIQQKN